MDEQCTPETAIYFVFYLCIYRPTQQIIYVPLLVNRFQESILLII